MRSDRRSFRRVYQSLLRRSHRGRDDAGAQLMLRSRTNEGMSKTYVSNVLRCSDQTSP